MKRLFSISGFGIYVAIVFLNAMTDLGHKIVLQNTLFKTFEGSELIWLTALVNALILLPFILLFTPAGFLSDKYPKTRIIQTASLAAVGITLGITASYYLGWFYAAFALTFVLAAQSAIYSPAKYGLIKEMVGSGALARANALVQAVTVVAILLGALLYSVGFEALYAGETPDAILRHIAPIGWVLVAASVLEWRLAVRLARLHRGETGMQRFDAAAYRSLRSLRANLAALREHEAVWLSIVGLAVLWGVAQLTVAIFGEHLKTTLGITDTVTAQGLLALSGVGMIAGSLFAGRMSRNYIETGLIPVGSVGVALSLWLLPAQTTLFGMGAVLTAFGFFAGLVLVPLNALIQYFTPEEKLGTVLAGNNFVQNVGMLLFLAVAVLAALSGATSGPLFAFAGAVAFTAALYTLYKLPQSLVRYLVRVLVRLRYRIDVEGLERIPLDKGVLLLGNHISFLDWAILQIAHPGRIRFVMERSYYEKPLLRPFLDFFGVIPISARGSKRALEQVTEALKRGDTVALFPEGHITRNGHLGEFLRGFEKACEGVDEDKAVIVPFYLRGLWEDTFSHASGKLKRSGRKDIGVSFGAPMSVHATAPEVKRAVFELSVRSWEHYAMRLPSLQEAWLAQLCEARGAFCIADSTGAELSRARFAAGVFAFRGLLSRELGPARRVGVVLPTTAAGAIGNMALLSLDRTVVNLNYSAGTDALRYAVEATGMDTVLTSERFLTRLKAKGFDIAEAFEGVRVVTMESLKEKLFKPKALLYLAAAKWLPRRVLQALFIRTPRDTDETAAILFSSGSEGKPKGVMLSHRNMMGNIKQTVTVLNPNDEDVMLGTLPIFHSFGLTVTTLLPLVEGIPVVCHPDPTDGFGIGKLAATYRATMLFATATFLRLYTRNRKLHPLMFEHLRMVVAGAEKLPEKVREAFKAKFAKEVYEGYGATETTPVAAVNLPDVLLPDTWRVQKGNKPGTVGLPVPGSTVRIVDPETFETLEMGEEGMVLIGGTQIMKGYLNDPEKTAAVIKHIDGMRWYVTGDKGKLDEEGFLTIVDRYSRFAKIGGEMVSLGMVEEALSGLFSPEERFALAAVPDEKKGEAIVLLYEGERALEEVMEAMGTLHLNPLYLPSKAYKVDAVPVLGTGKTDLKGVKALALELENAENTPNDQR